MINNIFINLPVKDLEKSKAFFEALGCTINKQFTLWAGVNNVFDRDPPIAGSSSGVGPTSSDNGNTFPQLYDALGRRVFLSLTAKF